MKAYFYTGPRFDRVCGNNSRLKIFMLSSNYLFFFINKLNIGFILKMSQKLKSYSFEAFGKRFYAFYHWFAFLGNFGEHSIHFVEKHVFGNYLKWKWPQLTWCIPTCDSLIYDQELYKHCLDPLKKSKSIQLTNVENYHPLKRMLHRKPKSTDSQVSFKFIIAKKRFKI